MVRLLSKLLSKARSYSRDTTDEDLTKALLERTRENEFGRGRQGKARDNVDSILQEKPKSDSNSKAFSLLDSQGDALSKWKDKLDIPNQTK